MELPNPKLINLIFHFSLNLLALYCKENTLHVQFWYKPVLLYFKKKQNYLIFGPTRQLKDLITAGGKRLILYKTFVSITNLFTN